MNLKLKEKIKESLSAVLPITGIVLMLSIFLVPMELGSIVMFLTGAVMLIVGMGFFQLGAEMAMTPIGEGVGVQISKMKKLITVLLTGFVMGVIITVSEPDLQVLAGQVPSVPNAVLIMTVPEKSPSGRRSRGRRRYLQGLRIAAGAPPGLR